MLRFALRLAGLLLLLLGAAPSAMAAQPASVLLRPDPSYYPQFFAMALSRDGFVYLGASDAVLRFDGLRWQRIGMPRPGAVRALLTDSRGRLWVGGSSCLGWLERQPDGSDRFVEVPVAALLAPEQREFADVWDLVEFDGHLYFRALYQLFEVALDYPAASARTATPVPAPVAADTEAPRSAPGIRVWTHAGRLGAIGPVAGRLLLQFRGQGLKRLEDDGRFHLLPGSAALGSPLALNLLDLGADGVLVVDVQPRLSLWRDGRVLPFPVQPPPADLDRVSSMQRLADGSIAFGGDDGVLRLYDPARASWSALSLVTGYISHVLQRDGALWLVTVDGVTRVPWPVREHIYGAADGLRSEVYGLHPVGDRLYTLTAAGVYESGLDGSRPLPPFRNRDWAGGETWDLRARNGELLLAESYALSQVRDSQRLQLGPDDLYPRRFLEALGQPDRLWVSTEGGVAVVRHDGHGWTLGERFEQPGATSFTLAERVPGELWLGSEDRGVLRLRFAEAPLRLLDQRRFDAADGIDYGAGTEAYVTALGGTLRASTRAGLFRLDGERFVPDDFDRLGNLIGSDEILQFVQGADGSLWAHSFHSVYQRRARPCKPLEGPDCGTWQVLDVQQPQGAIEALAVMPDGDLLIGSSGRIAHVRLAADPAGTGAAGAARAATRVVAARLESAGRPPRPLPLDQPGQLDHGSGTLVLELGHLDHASALPPQFQSRLLGLDPRWSAWSPRGSVGYTALPPGDYVFEARGRRRPGQVDGSARYAFSIAPRWYQRGSVQLLAAALALGLAAALLNYSHRRRLRRLAWHNRELDAQVRARTAELQDANARLRDLADRDGLTGVANRRRFDEVLAEAVALARRGGGALSLLIIDADRFKQYNDRHGHLAGDELLQRLATALRAQLREGTLLARYGGEEFALIVPWCDLAGALQLGERLRQAIAAMGELTISIGVAQYDRQLDDRPETLLQRADAALYRAKAAGRDRVLAADERPGPPGGTAAA